MIDKVRTCRPRNFLHRLSRVTVLLLVVLATASISQAQGTRVEGVIRDASGGAVPSAQIELHAKS